MGAEEQSHLFSKAWARIPPKVTIKQLEDAWAAKPLVDLRQGMLAIAGVYGGEQQHNIELRKLIDAAIAGTDPDIRHFLRDALLLMARNATLSAELGRVVVRHRRRTEHRHFRIGDEYTKRPEDLPPRPDQHLLHAAPGLDVRGEAELPQFLLMRCVSEMKRGKGRSSLGADLTGCYSTLLESAEGVKIQNSLKDSPRGQTYLDLLMEMVSEKQDPKHPKLEKVVTEVLEHWRSGEKVLIFCVRVRTSERLRDIIDHRIQDELKKRRKQCLGGEEKMKFLRSRLTGRDRDLVVLGLDRILWSVAWGGRPEIAINPSEFLLSDPELSELARLGLTYGVNVDGERVDRVFLFRATEHIIAIRLLESRSWPDSTSAILRRAAATEWVTNPYGLVADEGDDQPGEESTAFDERGSHTIYEFQGEPSESKIHELAARLILVRQHARGRKQTAIVDGYALAPSLWLGASPASQWENPDTPTGKCIELLHRHIVKLTRFAKDDEFADPDGLDVRSRGMVLRALRRALLRESVLLRLLPEKSELDESSWGELLAAAFFTTLPKQHESMADRIVVFLEDMEAASGKVYKPETSRGALFEATKLRGHQFVALVKGGGSRDTRERVFSGFNTPLLPEVLVCTRVGQEGIDLHRHCRHVVHYDLAWNPAELEQRTGRVDRLGSKTFRERGLAGNKIVLDIGVPFLAGTYDERMYEELRLRAQTFEVLTGGDFTAEHAESEEEKDAAARVLGRELVTLPASMLTDLRVKLEVFTD